jgi:H+/Cl- antiporter ClcA
MVHPRPCSLTIGIGGSGGIFASAARAPLISPASVVEMTGDLALTCRLCSLPGAGLAVFTHGTNRPRRPGRLRDGMYMWKC